MGKSKQIATMLTDAPAALDTLDELAAALGDDANFATTVTNSLATKLPITDPAIDMGTNKKIRFSGNIGEIGSVPGFQATNDANDGLRSMGMRASTLRFATGTNERLRIDDGGRIGIGVTPNSNISASTFPGNISLGEQGVLLGNDTSTQIGHNFYWNGSAFKYLGSGKASRIYQQSGEIVFQTTDDLGATDNNLTTMTSHMKIDSVGNVGIGTTGSGYKLQVDHGTTAQYASSIRNTADNLQLLLGTTTGALLNIQGKTISSNAAYQIALQAEGGNVGIGTANPGTKLHIQEASATGGGILLTNNNNSAGTYSDLKWQYSSADSSYASGIRFRQVDTSHGGQMEFYTDSATGAYTKQMQITEDGHISTPNQPVGYRRNVSASNTWITLNGNNHNIFSSWYTPAAWQQNSGANTIDDSGRFYAPVAGWYLVNPEIYATTGSNSSPYGYANVYKNGSNQFGGHIINYGGDTNDKMNSHSVIVYMTDTDYVQIGVYVAGTGSFQVYSPYCGYWVYFLG